MLISAFVQSIERSAAHACVGANFFERARFRCPAVEAQSTDQFACSIGCPSNGNLYVLRFCSTSRKIRKMCPPAVFGMRNDYSDVVTHGVTFQALKRAYEHSKIAAAQIP